jgi:hypothetical protein
MSMVGDSLRYLLANGLLSPSASLNVLRAQLRVKPSLALQEASLFNY